MVIAVGKIQGIYFTSSPKYVTSSAVAMEILCITNIGSNSSEKLVGGEKLLYKSQIVIFICANQQKCLKYTGEQSVSVQNYKDIDI